MLPRIKVVEIAQEIAAGVPDPAIAFDQTGENFGGETDIIPVILRRHPEAQDLGAVTGHDLLRGDDVPQRLGHLAPFPIDHHPRPRPPPGARWGPTPGADPSPRDTSLPASAGPAASLARRPD